MTADREILPGIDLDKDFDDIARRLEMVGLSPYESRAYVALVAHGFGDATTIATTARIPRTSSYRTLEALAAKGFATSTRGRPAIYHPEPPTKVRERVNRELERTFELLEYLHEIVRERGQPQLVYTIHEKAKVIEKICELLDKAQRSFMISTPAYAELKDRLAKKIVSARQRGVQVTVVTEPFQRAPEGVQVVRRKGLIATDVIADDEHALVAGPDLSACGYTDNALLASHLHRFMQIMLEE